MTCHAHGRESGVTLIELVVSIVVIAVAGAALMGTLAYLSGTGNTSILQAQAQSIANAYLNEILGKRFAPDGVEGSRNQYDDVRDYNNLDHAVAQDVLDNPAGNFRVRVTVGPGALNGVPAGAVRRIDVTVSYGNGSSVVASGYRTNYPFP
ncbi:MAG: prepilin-type N-terminal cleavage/methylation domain-containing protein [Steroidobacteraceae bacterium]|nr:prepilin-type N-terminal cleavage/methylation domain-containing protein [Steroidobacteraceae bacterium]